MIAKSFSASHLVILSRCSVCAFTCSWYKSRIQPRRPITRMNEGKRRGCLWDGGRNCVGGKKNAPFERRSFRFLYRFIIQYYMYTLSSWYYNYIIILLLYMRARISAASSNYQPLFRWRVRANDNYYESFINRDILARESVLWNLRAGSSRVIDRDRHHRIQESQQSRDKRIASSMNGNRRRATREETWATLSCMWFYIKQNCKQSQLYRYFNFQSLIKCFH